MTDADIDVVMNACRMLAESMSDKNKLGPREVGIGLALGVLVTKVDRLEAENTALHQETRRLRACVQTHHDQRSDDRCHLDDLKLYHDVLGLGEDPYVCALPPDADMEESCRRYIRQRRCPGVMVPLPGEMTIAQLTAEVERLQGVEAENATLREDNGRLTAALEGQGEASFVAGLRTGVSAENAPGWLQTPNERLGGETPQALLDRGEERRIAETIHRHMTEDGGS